MQKYGLTSELLNLDVGVQCDIRENVTNEIYLGAQAVEETSSNSRGEDCHKGDYRNLESKETLKGRVKKYTVEKVTQCVLGYRNIKWVLQIGLKVLPATFNLCNDSHFVQA